MSPSRHSRACRHSIAIAVATLACATAPGLALASEPGVAFRTAEPPSVAASEVVSVLEPAGGQFVYSNQSAAFAPRARFAIGKASRTEYTFFSPDEQQELKALQERLSAEQMTNERLLEGRQDGRPADAHARVTAAALVSRPSERTSHAARHPRACAPAALTDHLANLAWPKVVQSGNQVCVPKHEFADKPDWRDHVWCFDQGDGRVR